MNMINTKSVKTLVTAMAFAGLVGGTGPAAAHGMMERGSGMMGMGGYDEGCSWMMGGDMMGMGPGMMGGNMMGMGPGMGMHRGMMGGYGPGAALNLTDQQQTKVMQIQDELRKKHWELMGKMNDEYAKFRQLYQSDQRDAVAMGKQQQRIFDLRRQMMESSIDAQNRMEAVLTPEQREKQRGWGGMMGW